MSDTEKDDHDYLFDTCMDSISPDVSDDELARCSNSIFDFFELNEQAEQPLFDSSPPEPHTVYPNDPETKPPDPHLEASPPFFHKNSLEPNCKIEIKPQDPQPCSYSSSNNEYAGFSYFSSKQNLSFFHPTNQNSFSHPTGNRIDQYQSLILGFPESALKFCRFLKKENSQSKIKLTASGKEFQGKFYKLFWPFEYKNVLEKKLVRDAFNFICGYLQLDQMTRDEFRSIKKFFNNRAKYQDQIIECISDHFQEISDNIGFGEVRKKVELTHSKCK